MIELYFKDILLGTLDKKGKYIYNSSFSEKLATNSYFLIEYFFCFMQFKAKRI